MLRGLRIWTVCLLLVVLLPVTTCDPVKLYGCRLPEKPTLRQLLRFQRCVAKVNKVTVGHGGRWGRSISSRQDYSIHSDKRILRAIQNEIVMESMWTGLGKVVFLHDRSRKSPWIKSISNELDITVHVIASQLSGHCDIISNRLWRHQQRESVRHGDDVNRPLFLPSFMNSLCRVRNKIGILVSISLVPSQLGK